MREIKFRAWDETQRYMAYQGTPDLETIQSFMFHFGDKKLMQFTGLQDKNGVDIYEHDYLENDFGKSSIVKFIDGCFMICNCGDGNTYPFTKGALKNKKVISNMFEYSKHKAQNGCH